ncbi:hypothetical protein GCM10009524_52070 [Spirilliplanes yamanashiensis]
MEHLELPPHGYTIGLSRAGMSFAQAVDLVGRQTDRAPRSIDGRRMPLSHGLAGIRQSCTAIVNIELRYVQATSSVAGPRTPEWSFAQPRTRLGRTSLIWAR